MNTHDTITELERYIGPMAAAFGLTLWGIEFAEQEGRSVLRVYVDCEGGVDVDQCARLSRDVSVLLDAEDMIPGRYNLEVSSPGLDRPFFNPGQMQGYEGQEIKVRIAEPREGSKNFIGTLTRVGEESFSIESEGRVLEFDFNEVKKAHLRYTFPEKAKGRKA
ncbi:ribosome maturation factor RimP [Desulfocurvus sp. DL9XJH121]